LCAALRSEYSFYICDKVGRHVFC